MMDVLSIGDLAPDFSLAAGDGETISLRDFFGKRQVVLYFYPKDDTPGCTQEACDFRDQLAAATEKGAVVLGVSMDSAESHRQFGEKFLLPFALLADTTGEVCRAYGVSVRKERPGREPYDGTLRTTFVIGKDGRVKKIFSKVKVEGHVREVLAEL